MVKLRVMENHPHTDLVLVDGFDGREHITVILKKEEATDEMIVSVNDWVTSEFNKDKKDDK